MFRPASRSLLRGAQSSASAFRTPLRHQQLPRRFISTAPPHKTSRSWKNSAVRWGIAIAGIYYYNTSNVFAEEPAYPISTRPDPDESTATLPTLDTLSPTQRQKERSVLSSVAADDPLSDTLPKSHPSSPSTSASEPPYMSDPTALEDEASSEGAFNPETGEINWDCPCLGGMAHGPCGPQFREAFSCFVFSQEEPKGMDCIEKFKGMQECFREHPDVYGSELDEEEVDEELRGEIAAREADAGSQRRLLEEAPPTRVEKPLFGGGSSASSKVESPSSSEPHPSMSEEHEVEAAKRESFTPAAPPPPSSEAKTQPSQQPTPPPSPRSDISSTKPPQNDSAASSNEHLKSHHETETWKRKDNPPNKNLQGGDNHPMSEVKEEHPRREVFDPDNQLVPKAWHDSRDAKVPEDKKK